MAVNTVCRGCGHVQGESEGTWAARLPSQAWGVAYVSP